MMKSTHTIILLIFLTVSTQAMEIGGINIPERYGEMKLLGAGVLRKGFFFRIYAGALYANMTVSEEKNIVQAPKRLNIHYYHDIPKNIMINVANNTLKKNLNDKQFRRIEPHIKALHRAYLDGKKGSVASVVHHPGHGLSYLFNGQLIATIENEEFARAYFKIWLGEEPSSRSMKQALLGAHDGEKDE